MAITVPVLGGTTLPQVGHSDSYTEIGELRGSDVIMASGAIATDLVQSGAKTKFELRWVALDETQVTAVRTAWATVITASVAFTSPLGGSFNVTRDEGSKELEVKWNRAASGPRGDVTMRLREV